VPAVVSAIAADAKKLIISADGSRSYATRRLIVDALKKAQNDASLIALRDSRDAINATLNTLNPTDRALTEELLARINAALSPYYN
jgi:UDP-N-acetylmuramyl tripeptide synthase